MSEVIKAVQRRIGENPDGIAGPLTWAAIAKAVGAAIVTLPAVKNDSSASTGSQEGHVDSRSEGNIATLHLRVQPLARRLIRIAKDQGMTFKVTSAYRSYAEQDELYEQGRTKPGKIVTNARGGQSAHQYKLAFDVTEFDGSQPVWESRNYDKMVNIGESIGLSVGAKWTKPDLPHYFLNPWPQMDEKHMIAELRRRHDNSIDYFA